MKPASSDSSGSESITAIERWSHPRVVAPLLILACATLSYWYADRNLPSPDEGAYLTAAAKILDGGIFYRDIDAYPFPGISYLLAAAMWLFGENLSVARALGGGIYCITVMGIYAAALALVDRRRAMLCGLSLLTLKFLAFPSFTMFFYAETSAAAAIVALALFLRHRFSGASWLLFWAGVLCGVAVVTKQSSGLYVVAAIAAILAWPALVGLGELGRASSRGAEVASFAAGVAAPVGAMSAYFAFHGLFCAMVASGLVRPFTGYLPSSGVPFLPMLAWWDLGSIEGRDALPYLSTQYVQMIDRGLLPFPGGQRLYWLAGEVFSRAIYTAIPIVYGMCVWRRIRLWRRPTSDDPKCSIQRARFFSAATISLAITASAFPRADFTHIVTILPAVVLTLFSLRSRDATGVQRSGPVGGVPPAAPPSRRFSWEVLPVVALLLVVGAMSLRLDRSLTYRLSLDRAQLWVRPNDAWVESLVRYVDEQIPAGDPLFVYGHEAYLYFLADRYFPWKYSQLYPGMAGADGGERLAQAIADERPRLIVEGISEWPAMPPLKAYTRSVDRLIARNYTPATRALYRAHPTRNRPPGYIFQLWRLRGF